jgi:hypothetical protein
MVSTPPALHAFLADIERALEAGLYQLAIAGALSIPDVCANLENEPTDDRDKLRFNRNRQRKRYKEWFRVNASAKFAHLTAEDCYSMRCGVLHQGNLGRPDDQYDRLILGLPGARVPNDSLIHIPSTATFNGKTISEIFDQPFKTGKVLHMLVVQFCMNMVEAAREWATKNFDPHVQANVPRMTRLRPEGIPGFSVFDGMPLIA